MKAHLRFIFVLIFPFLLFSIACTKETKPKGEIMPPYTDTGAHTFACKVNGKVWISQGSRFDYLHLWYNSREKMLGISAANDGVAESIGFSAIKNVTGPGEFIIGAEAGITADYHIYSSQPGKRYETKDGYGGKLIVKKLDTINHICSGTFYFDAVSTSVGVGSTEPYKKGEVVHITEGQFDFKYKR